MAHHVLELTIPKDYPRHMKLTPSPMDIFMTEEAVAELAASSEKSLADFLLALATQMRGRVFTDPANCKKLLEAAGVLRACTATAMKKEEESGYEHG